MVSFVSPAWRVDLTGFVWLPVCPGSGALARMPPIPAVVDWYAKSRKFLSAAFKQVKRQTAARASHSGAAAKAEKPRKPAKVS